MNSGPLSLRRWPGAPRIAVSSSSTATTSSPRQLLPTSIAGHSRVKSSSTTSSPSARRSRFISLVPIVQPSRCGKSMMCRRPRRGFRTASSCILDTSRLRRAFSFSSSFSRGIASRPADPYSFRQRCSVAGDTSTERAPSAIGFPAVRASSAWRRLATTSVGCRRFLRPGSFMTDSSRALGPRKSLTRGGPVQRAPVTEPFRASPGAGPAIEAPRELAAAPDPLELVLS